MSVNRKRFELWKQTKRQELESKIQVGFPNTNFTYIFAYSEILNLPSKLPFCPLPPHALSSKPLSLSLIAFNSNFKTLSLSLSSFFSFYDSLSLSRLIACGCWKVFFPPGLCVSKKLWIYNTNPTHHSEPQKPFFHSLNKLVFFLFFFLSIFAFSIGRGSSWSSFSPDATQISKKRIISWILIY